MFDQNTVCSKCRGFDCDFDRHCDVCMDWSQEEMEAYVKHRKSLVHKGKRGKDSFPKPLSSPGPCHTPSQLVSLTVTDGGDCISS